MSNSEIWLSISYKKKKRNERNCGNSPCLQSSEEQRKYERNNALRFKSFRNRSDYMQENNVLQNSRLLLCSSIWWILLKQTRKAKKLVFRPIERVRVSVIQIFHLRICKSNYTIDVVTEIFNCKKKNKNIFQILRGKQICFPWSFHRNYWCWTYWLTSF